MVLKINAEMAKTTTRIQAVEREVLISSIVGVPEQGLAVALF
ncbi:hypothetical protein L580_0912 [Serratia fonticola AU-P3(3)]|nr:hypothetical protein L580_0912 [Serratia fonticola AU-P3(3)]